MKKRTVLLSTPCLCVLASLFFFISGCNKKVESAKMDEDLRSALQQDIQQEFDGRTIIKVTSGNELLIASSSANNDIVDHAFMLTVDPKASINIKNGDLGLSSIFFYKDHRAIAVHSEITNEVYFFGISEDASKHKIDSLTSSGGAKAILKANILGFGLSSIKGKFDINTLINTTKKYVTNLLVLCDLQNKYTTQQKTAAINDDAGMNCLSGGSGAVSCTWTVAVINQSCSVSCGAGYYACCNALMCHCYPGTELYGQCGGEGYTGNAYCEAGTTCVYVNPYYSQCE